VRPSAALLACAGLVACVDAAAPRRPVPYAYGVALSNGFEVVFRWPASALPVRVWVEPVGDLPGIVRDGLRLWEAAALYGEFRGTLVDDSTRADVIVTLGEPENPGPGAVLACSAATLWGVYSDSTIVLPFRTVLKARIGWSPVDVTDCFRIVAAHEIGHPLGLLLHSDDATDLMYGIPTATALSPRDRATFAVLYHTTPTVGLPAGR
jgi:predicted Zn-dependent protease